MKECKHFKKNISAYVDNMLTNTQKQKFEAHLKACSSCQKEVDKLKSIIEFSSSLSVKAPDVFTKNVMEKIENLHSEKPKILPYARYASALVAIFLAVVVLKTPVMDYFEKNYVDTPKIQTTQNTIQSTVKEVETTQEEKEEVKAFDKNTDLAKAIQPKQGISDIQNVKEDKIESVPSDATESAPLNEDNQQTFEFEAVQIAEPAKYKMKSIGEVNTAIIIEETTENENDGISMASSKPYNVTLNIETTLSAKETLDIINSTLKTDYTENEGKIEILLSFDDYTLLYETLKDNTSFSGFENVNFGEDVNIVILSK